MIRNVVRARWRTADDRLGEAASAAGSGAGSAAGWAGDCLDPSSSARRGDGPLAMGGFVTI
jgi:hypothetical protein